MWRGLLVACLLTACLLATCLPANITFSIAYLDGVSQGLDEAGALGGWHVARQQLRGPLVRQLLPIDGGEGACRAGGGRRRRASVNERASDGYALPCPPPPLPRLLPPSAPLPLHSPCTALPAVTTTSHTTFERPVANERPVATRCPSVSCRLPHLHLTSALPSPLCPVLVPLSSHLSRRCCLPPQPRLPPH